MGEELHCLGRKHCSYYYGSEVQPRAEGCMQKAVPRFWGSCLPAPVHPFILWCVMLAGFLLDSTREKWESEGERC